MYFINVASCALHLLACQVRVTAGDSGLCCYVPCCRKLLIPFVGKHVFETSVEISVRVVGKGSRDSWLVRVPDSCSNTAGAAGEFSSPELTLCADSYSVSVPPPF